MESGPAMQTEGWLRRSADRADNDTAPVQPTGAVDMAAVDVAIERARTFLAPQQRADGSYPGRVHQGADSTAQTAIAMAYAGALSADEKRQLVNEMRHQQAEDGSFPAYLQQRDDRGRLDGTAMAYGAMFTLGIAPQDAAMQKALTYIESHGGFEATSAMTRPLLVVAGVLDPYLLGAIPFRWLLIPGGAELADSRFNSYFRVLMRVMPALTSALRVRARLDSPPGLLWRLTRDKVVRYLYDHQNPVGNWCGVADITSLTLVALLALGVPADDPRVRRAIDYLRNSGRTSGPSGEGQRLSYPSFNSAVWSTACTVCALVASGSEPSDEVITKAAAYILDNQSRTDVPARWQGTPPGTPRHGAWACEADNPTCVDCDSTGIALWGLLYARSADSGLRTRLEHGIERAFAWLGPMQNANGGFPTFNHGLPSKPPGPMSIEIPTPPSSFAEGLQMLLNLGAGIVGDPPTADVNGRLLQAYGMRGLGMDDPHVARVVDFLRYDQYATGAFWGRWESNYVPATCDVLTGLAMVGCDMEQPWIRRALDWLLEHQNPDGGWGESQRSYTTLAWAGRGESNAFDTAHVLRTLVVMGRADSAPALGAVQWLVSDQGTDGADAAAWPNRGSYWVLMWPWPYYRLVNTPTVWALWALGLWRQHRSG